MNLHIFDEWKKISGWKYILAFLVFMVSANMVIGLLFHDDSYQDPALLENEKQTYIELQEESELTEDSDLLGIAEMCREKIEIISYCQENDIAYQQLSVYGNLAKSGTLNGMILIFMIVAVYAMMGIEEESGTWKQLVLHSGSRRGLLFWKKLVAAVVLVLAFTGLAYGVTAIYGMIRYGSMENVQVEYVDGAIRTSSFNEEILGNLIELSGKGLLYSALALLLGFVMHGGKLGMLIPIGCVLFGSAVQSFLSRYPWEKFLPFHYTEMLEQVCVQRDMTGIVSVMYVLVLTVIIYAILYRVMKRGSL